MVDDSPTDVVLRVPARPPYARIVRVAAAALALREGMGFTEIDDLRLAIDEAMILLLDGVDPDGQTGIDIVFHVDRGPFELEAARTEAGPAVAVSDAAVHRFDAIASGLVDEYEIDPDHGWIRLRKAAVDEAERDEEVNEGKGAET